MLIAASQHYPDDASHYIISYLITGGTRSEMWERRSFWLAPELPARRTGLKMKHPCYWRECFQLGERAGKQQRSIRAYQREGRLIKQQIMEVDP